MSAAEETSLDSLLGARAAPGDGPALFDVQAGPTSRAALREAAQAVAEALAAHGLGPGHRVALLAERVPGGVAALAGTLGAGCCVIPLDVRAPARRLEALISRCAPAAVLGQGHGLRRLGGLRKRGAALPLCLALDGAPGLPDEVELMAAGDAAGLPISEEAAYAMFTSGSTGEPKGVVFSRQTLAALLAWFAGQFSVTGRDRVLALAPLNFDISLVELLLPLTQGGCACLAPPAAGASAPALAEFLGQAEVTLAYMVGSVARGLAREIQPGAPLPLTRLIVSGEPALPGWVARLQRALPGAELFNLYGATELPVGALHRIPRPPPDPIPLGQAVDGVSLHLRAEGGRDARPGEEGEICAAGSFLPLCHLDAPDLDQRRLVELRGERHLRTGDWARRDQAGALHFVGRQDEMVKVRGHRVDLMEVDRTLCQVPGVDAALAVVINHQTLAAGICCADEADLANAQRHCARELPGYMVPTRLVRVPDLPRTTTGKLDRWGLARLLGAAAPPGEV